MNGIIDMNTLVIGVVQRKAHSQNWQTLKKFTNTNKHKKDKYCTTLPYDKAYNEIHFVPNKLTCDINNSNEKQQTCPKK